MDTTIKDVDVTIFGILDGHGGEFAAVFAKEQLMDRLNKKIEDAINIANGKVSPRPIKRHIDTKDGPNENNTNDENTAPKSPLTPTSQRRKTLKKTMSQDDDCNPAKSNCNKEQDSFLSKLSSIRITKESFLKTHNKIVKPTEHDAGYYVDRDRKINFGKMVTDLVLLTDYELVEKAKKLVSSSFIFSFDRFIRFIILKYNKSKNMIIL